MKLDLRSRILFVSLALITVVAGIALACSRLLVEGAVVSTIEADLRHRVSLALISNPTWPATDGSAEAWRRISVQLARASGTRVSVIRRDGVVLGDSDVDAAEVGKVGNHRLRPEVQDALRNGIGIARRRSQTVGQELLYVAIPYGDPSEPIGVLRMALNLDAVDREIAFVQRGITIGALLALLLVAAVAGYASSWIAKGTRELVGAAKRMAQGDLETRLPELQPSDLSELGGALQQLASTLSSSLKVLAKERDWMSSILSRMREGVLLLDRDQRVRLVNPSLREMLLLDEGIVGKPLLESVRNSDLQRLLDEAKSTGEARSREIEVAGLKPRRLLVRAAPLGVDRAVFAVVLDLTELRQLQTLRKDFVDNVSHELRTPVSAIRSAAETLRDVPNLESKSLRTFVEMIARQAERLGDLVDDLMELARIESREFKVVLKPVQLAAAVDQLLSLFEERAKKQGQTLCFVIPPTIPPVHTDSRALEHILSNLLDNAVKYSGAGATIRLQAEQTGRHVRICIEDTGPGIAEEHLPRLFERFYRVDSGRSRDQGGTGLGLSIVKHLLEGLGSQIRVESTLGVGTRFTFLLPLVPEANTTFVASA